MYKQRIAEFLLDSLAAMNVRHVFGLPGSAIEPLYNAMAPRARAGELVVVTARSEGAAAFMADAYSRETGRLGVVCATTGPGATNMLTAAATAFADRIPVLYITAQTPLAKFARNPLQESSDTGIDTVALFAHLSKLSTLVSDPNQFVQKLVIGIRRALSPPCGPVHLSIPVELFNAEIIAPRVPIEALSDMNPPRALDGAEPAFAAVEGAARLTIYVGDQVGGPAAAGLDRFARETGAQIVGSYAAKGWLDHHHPGFRGLIGFGGHDSAELALRESDIVLAVGATMRDLCTNGGSTALLSDRLVHVDEHSESHHWSFMARLRVLASPDVFVAELCRRALARRVFYLAGQTVFEQPRFAAGDGGDRLHPAALFTWLADHLPDDARVFPDAGNSWPWAAHYLSNRQPRGYFRIPATQGPMGWGIAASVATSLITRDPVVCIAGDGCMLLSSQELTVAVEHRRPLVIIVVNDSALGMVRHIQSLGGFDSVGTAIAAVDFAGMASAMGARGIVVSTLRELRALDLRSLFGGGQPTVIDVRIDERAIAPLGARLRSIRKAE